MIDLRRLIDLRRFGLLLVASLVLPVLVAAQGPAGAGSGRGSGSQSRPSSVSSSDFPEWQFAAGYQFYRVNLLGTPFNTNGLNLTITRFFGRWFGVDGQVGVGFGNTGTSTNPPNLKAHSVFAGGGPRVAFRGSSHIEPWVHFVVGSQYFRFTQTAGFLGSNRALGFMGGGGVDFLLGPHLAVRVEGEALGTRFFSTNQRSFQAVTGLVFNF